MSDPKIEITEEEIKAVSARFSVYPNIVSDFEATNFLEITKLQGLDWRLNQCCLTPFSNKKKAWENGKEVEKWTTSWAIITQIAGFRSVAERTKTYSPGRTTEYKYDENKKILSATAYVKKLVQGTWHEYGYEAFMSEYARQSTTKEGKKYYSGQWADKPHLMLAKCAEAGAIRKGWPAEVGALRTEEEALGQTEEDLGIGEKAALIPSNRNKDEWEQEEVKPIKKTEAKAAASIVPESPYITDTDRKVFIITAGKNGWTNDAQTKLVAEYNCINEKGVLSRNFIKKEDYQKLLAIVSESPSIEYLEKQEAAA